MDPFTALFDAIDTINAHIDRALDDLETDLDIPEETEIPQSPDRVQDVGVTQDFNALKSQLNELAALGWADEEASWSSNFQLQVSAFNAIASPSQTIDRLLSHARKSTPKFKVPQMTPRTIVESTPFAAGLFEVDEEGWVTIKVSPDFWDDRSAAQAILAHEVCHYLLENAGIRYADVAINERYTDLCMFICGFGPLFLAGYKRDFAQQDDRPGHRLGYLSDEEYQYADRYVVELRQVYQLKLQSELEIQKRRLRERLQGNDVTLNRLIEYERRRSPYKSEIELYQDAIDRLERG